ncbi:MAG: tetratricopeptide repeat protein [Ardenticatenaceae bacterium]
MAKRSSIPKSPPEVLNQVRKACKNYDKPKRIGKLPLSSVALRSVLLERPNHPTDIVGRGQALRHVMKASLEQMKPAKRHTRKEQVYLSLHCYMHKRDPYNGFEIAQVVPYLESHYQIPQSTYFHHLRTEGLPQLSYVLSRYLARHTWIEAVPWTARFVGREAELAFYHNQLERDNLAVIEGVGGIGKSALAGQLARSINDQRPVCWVTIRPGLNDSWKGVVYGWAAFLAQHDYPQLWAFMSATADEQKALNDFFPLLKEGLTKVRPLLCVDNLEAMPNSEKGFWSLLQMVQEEPHTTALLVSQRRPPLQRLGDYPLLSGLSSAEVKHFMAQRKIELSLTQLETITTYTLGNPRLLELWSAHLRLVELNTPNLASLDTLRKSQAATNFLSTEIVTALSKNQQLAIQLLALSRRPLDGFLLQHLPKELPLLPAGIEAHDLLTLQQLGLIQHNLGHQWVLSPLLSSYLLSSSPTDEHLELHQWLARFYSLQGQTVEAAYHAIEGRQRERALLWLAEQQELLIKQGQAAAISVLLQNIQADELSTPMRQVLRELRVEAWGLIGNYKAVENEIKATDKLNTLFDQARSEYMSGQLSTERGQVWQAADHHQLALRFLATKQASFEGWLHRDLSWSLMQQGDLDEAWDEAERAQIALQSTFGTIARRRGELDVAIHHFEQALAIGQKQDEPYKLMRVYNNLGLTYLDKGEIKKALAIFESNLKLIEDVGELLGKAITHINIGNCYMELGLEQAQLAIEHLKLALPIYTRLEHTRGQTLAHLNLAEQYLRIGKVTQARQHANKAIAIDKKRIPIATYAEAQRIHAEVLLAEGQLSEALTAANRALNELRVPGATTHSADAFNNPLHAKWSSQTLARIHTARQKPAEAEKYSSLAKQLGQRIKS